MAGTWERLQNSHFALDPKIEVEVYRWHAPGQSGSYVDFQSPKESPHRRFYPIEVLQAVTRNEAADDYIERMCKLGIALLPELESVMRKESLAATGSTEWDVGTEIPTQETLEFLLALFQSRREGHQRVTRDFHREDDFYETRRSRTKDNFLVPGAEPPPKSMKTRLKGQDIIRHLATNLLADNPSLPSNETDLPVELLIHLSPMRTPLDQVLMEGIFRKGNAAKISTLNDIARRVAPALINGIEIDQDSQFLLDHLDDFRHFLRRLGEKFFTDRAGFYSWLQREREKGFVRLLPGFKGFSKADRAAAREKGTRFYRRVLWTSFEAMSRCFGVTALFQWVSFFESEVTSPSPDEQRAFRCYHAPLVLAAGLPLWFFGPNVLRWIMDGFIDKVWGWAGDQDFDALTTLIALYGQTAHNRRDVDANKKRTKIVGQHRPDLRADPQARQYEETRGGQTFTTPHRTVPPDAIMEDDVERVPDFPISKVCPCGGSLKQLFSRDEQGKPTLVKSWILVDTVCTNCKKEKLYRIRLPE